MPTNEFLTFATSVGALVDSQATYAAAPYRSTGFPPGIAYKNQVNKVIRQAAFGVAGLSEYMMRVLNQDVLDNADLADYVAQVWQALLGGGYFVDSGSASALVVATPAGLTFGAPFAGLTVTLKTNAACSGATMFNWASTGAVAVTYPNGLPLLQGAYDKGALVTLRHDGTKWQLASGGASFQFTTSAVSPTVYVRTDGSDVNDGSANTAAKAVATLAQAYRLASRYYVPGGSVTIQLGNAGTYAAASPPNLPTPIVIQGDPGNPQNYVISGSGTGTAVLYVVGSDVTFYGVTLNNAANTYHLVAAAYGGVVTLSFTRLSATGTGNTLAAVRTFAGGIVTLGTAVTVVSNFGWLLLAGGGNIAVQTGATVVASGTPAFAWAAVQAQDGAAITLGGSTWSGAATGVRYSVSTNGVIDTAGGGASFIFGGSAGTTASGGQYV